MTVFPRLLCVIGVASSAMAVEPLHNYTNFTTHRLDAVNEASGVTYNWDTDTLFAIGDEGEALVQIKKNGEPIDRMHFDYSVSPRENRGLDDAEGVAYVGNNTFLIADERDFMARATTYEAEALRTQAYFNSRSYDFDYTGAFKSSSANTGLEDLAYDPVDKAMWGVKELGPLCVFKALGIAHVPGTAGTPFSVSEPIARREISRWETRPTEAPLGVVSVSGIYALSACKAFPEGHPRRMNLLLLARDARKIVEVTRTGLIVDSLDISGLGRGTIEGMTMDNNGVIYLVSEQTSAPNNFSGLHVLTPPPAPGVIDQYTSAATYHLTGELNLAEASGLTYNWDTNSLFVVEDEGNAIMQISKTGQVLNFMALQGGSRSQKALDDPEGIAYMGNGEFMFADERDNVGRVGTYDPAVIRTQAELQAEVYAFGAPTGNTGLEGVSIDPLGNSVWGVQENPSKLYKMTFSTEIGSSPVVSEPLVTELAAIAQAYGVTVLSDIFVLAASDAYATNEHILLLARDQNRLLEIDRFGRLIATLDISGLGRTKIEGMTMDSDGVLYLVSEREESGTSIHDGRGALHVLTLPKHEVTGTGRGRATLVGTANGDEIYGNPASDILTGGAGQDTFVFKTLRDGPDTITDFTPGEDKIDVGALLDSLAYTGLNPLQDALQDGTVRVIASSTGPVVQVRSNGSYRPLAQLSSAVTLEQASRAENFLFKTHKIPAAQ